MKSFTDFEQSNRLAEILPPESADMKILSFGIDIKRRVVPIDDIAVLNREDEIPCWSLAALMYVMPTIDDGFEPKLYRSLDKYCCTYESEEDNSGLFRVADNCVDACYEVILKLKEYNLL